MKKIINGKKYDTETAEEIHCFENEANPEGVYYIYEQLYRKKTSEFFLRMKGFLDMDQCGEGEFSEIIKPLSDDETKKWCEKHLSGDEYEKLFGEVDE